MRRAFTLIELMICISIVAIILAIAVPNLMAAKESTAPQTPKPAVEMVLNDIDLNYVGYAKVIVLPTGERVLFLSGSHGIAACLLPPLPKEAKVEK